MKKSIFKKGDKVFEYRHGWGIVDRIRDSLYPINVNFGGYSYDYTCDGQAFSNGIRVLSFTEYTIEGFSQKRPEELPKKGQIVWGRGEFQTEWHIGHFYNKLGDRYLLSSHPNPTGWHNIVQEITTENPYKDEETAI